LERNVLSSVLNKCVRLDWKAFGLAMLELFNQSSVRARFGIAAAEHARECFSWDVVLGMYKEYWDIALQRRREIRELRPVSIVSFSETFGLFGGDTRRKE
jgi:hypothetical protein